MTRLHIDYSVELKKLGVVIWGKNGAEFWSDLNDETLVAMKDAFDNLSDVKKQEFVVDGGDGAYELNASISFQIYKDEVYVPFAAFPAVKLTNVSYDYVVAAQDRLKDLLHKIDDNNIAYGKAKVAMKAAKAAARKEKE